MIWLLSKSLWRDTLPIFTSIDLLRHDSKNSHQPASAHVAIRLDISRIKQPSNTRPKPWINTFHKADFAPRKPNGSTKSRTHRNRSYDLYVDRKSPPRPVCPWKKTTSFPRWLRRIISLNSLNLVEPPKKPFLAIRSAFKRRAQNKSRSQRRKRYNDPFLESKFYLLG